MGKQQGRERCGTWTKQSICHSCSSCCQPTYPCSPSFQLLWATERLGRSPPLAPASIVTQQTVTRRSHCMIQSAAVLSPEQHLKPGLCFLTVIFCRFCRLIVPISHLTVWLQGVSSRSHATNAAASSSTQGNHTAAALQPAASASSSRVWSARAAWRA